MDYLKILHENPDLADEFDSLFDFFLLDELSPRDDAEGRCTFSMPGMAFARDGSGGEYHLLEDGSIGYYSSEGAVSYTHLDGGRHGYDNMFCDEHNPSELANRPLKRYEIPASKLVLELGYSCLLYTSRCV